MITCPTCSLPPPPPPPPSTPLYKYVIAIAIPGGASSHLVGSDLEEIENDNLSDMLSSPPPLLQPLCKYVIAIAIPEGASSHSMGSDLEEIENDNLSDMLSSHPPPPPPFSNPSINMLLLLLFQKGHPVTQWARTLRR